MCAQGGAMRGGYRKLALAAVSLAAVGFAFALLATAVELSKEPPPLPGDDLGIVRDSSAYRLFLAVGHSGLRPIAATKHGPPCCHHACAHSLKPCEAALSVGLHEQSIWR